jgi:hypothetical protein
MLQGFRRGFAERSEGPNTTQRKSLDGTAENFFLVARDGEYDGGLAEIGERPTVRRTLTVATSPIFALVVAGKFCT